MKIAVILPALNEEASIASVIKEIQTQPIECDIIVADSSTDRTADIARSLGASVIPVKARGKGNAVKIAIQNTDHDYVFMMDSDGTYPAYYLCDMLAKLESGYQVVVGERKPANKESMKLYNKVCNILLNTCNQFFYGGVNDICSGMWGFQGQILKELNLSSPDFTLEADIFTSTYIGRYKLARIPIEYRERIGGRSKIKFKDGLKIAWFLVKRSLQ